MKTKLLLTNDVHQYGKPVFFRELQAEGEYEVQNVNYSSSVQMRKMNMMSTELLLRTVLMRKMRPHTLSLIVMRWNVILKEII